MQCGILDCMYPEQEKDISGKTGDMHTVSSSVSDIVSVFIY